jgi:hypothetical protein
MRQICEKKHDKNPKSEHHKTVSQRQFKEKHRSVLSRPIILSADQTFSRSFCFDL